MSDPITEEGNRLWRSAMPHNGVYPDILGDLKDRIVAIENEAMFQATNCLAEKFGVQGDAIGRTYDEGRIALALERIGKHELVEQIFTTDPETVARRIVTEMYR